MSDRDAVVVTIRYHGDEQAICVKPPDVERFLSELHALLNECPRAPFTKGETFAPFNRGFFDE